jgi:cullin 1
MDPQDAELFKRVEEEVHRLADLVERDLRTGTFRLALDMYVVIYNAATRCKVGEVEEQYTAAQDLYQRFGDLMTDVVLNRPMAIKSDSDSEAIFNAVISKWTQFKVIQSWMLKSFRYLSRFYVVHCNVKPLEAVSLTIFFQLFQQYSPAVGKHVLSLFRAERKGEFVNKDDLRLAVDVFNSMALVENGDTIQMRDFMEPFLRETRAFYKTEAAQWITQLSASEFLVRADQCIREEQERAQRLLPQSMQQVLILNVEQQVLANHLHNLINMPGTGFLAMLRDWRVEQMGHTVTMIARLKQPGLEPLAAVVGQHCRSEGQSIAKKYSGAAEVDVKGYTTEFIDLHEKYINLLMNQLQSHVSFQNAIKDAFEATLNCGIQAGDPPATVTCSEMISSYCDFLLRSGTEHMSDEEVEDIFTKIVSLFLRVIDRDMFQEFLRKHLSRRLLTSPSFNEELEKSLIGKFKAKCGTSFTSRLEGMINDRNISQQISNEFLEVPEAKLCKFDFTCQVLTMGFWPTFPEDKAVVPPAVQEMISRFQEFYLARGKSKKLQWIHSLGSATITATFRRGNKEFTMAVFQGLVLMLFNETNALTLAQVAERSGLDADEVKRVVHSFCHPRVKVLLRDTEQGSLNVTDVVRINEDFSSAQKKMKLPLAVQRVAAQAAQVTATVEEDRKPAIDACVVRIMKSRKQMEHTLLVAAVIDVLQNRFRPDPKLIKLRIEDLINREYLERLADKPGTYVYLA